MRATGFGWSFLSKPTPAGIDTFSKAFAAGSTFTIGFIQTSDLLSPHAAAVTSGLLGYVSGMILIFAQFSGVKTDSGERVPISKVEVMETK